MSKKNNIKESTIQDLTDKYIDNVEVNFNLYLLNDISDAGEIDQLFDKESWYLYYLTGAWDLHGIMNLLLGDPEENRELLLKAINIKRVVDKELIKHANEDYELIYKDLAFNNQHSKVIELNHEKIKETQEFLDNLFTALKNKNWIDSDVDQFKSNFVESNNQVYINWTSTRVFLAGTIKYLAQKQYINFQDRPVDLMSKHFRLKNKLANRKSLEVTYSQVFTEGFLDESFFHFIDQCNK